MAECLSDELPINGIKCSLEINKVNVKREIVLKVDHVMDDAAE